MNLASGQLNGREMWRKSWVSAASSSSPPTRGSSRVGTRVVWVSLAGPTVAVFKPASMPKQSYTVWSVFPASTRYFRPSESQLMVNFVVDDVEGALALVVAAGGKAIGKVREYPYGRFGWFQDPDGNKVELWQPARQERKSSRKRR